MGYFLSVSAVRGCSAEVLGDAISAVMAAHGVATEPSSGPPDPRTDLSIFAGTPWTIVLWPEHFNVHDIAICAQLSKTFGTISTVHTYDEEYWTHALCVDGNVIDRFCSMPGYFAKGPQESARLAAAWRGNATVLASTIGCDPARLSPYLVHRPPQSGQPVPKPGLISRLFGAKTRPHAPVKAHAEDEFDLDNFWVFVDFWKQAGIPYPANMRKYDRVIRLAEDFSDRLPVGTDDDL